MSGTVNIARGIFTDAAFKDQPLTEREAFMWLIMEASYTRREKRIGSAAVWLDRGQLATSVRFMADAWKWPKSTVCRFIERLKKRDMIGTGIGTGVTVITICKYEEYQNAHGAIGTHKKQKRDSSGTAAGQQRDKPNTGNTGNTEDRDTNVSLVLFAPEPDQTEAAISKYNEAAKAIGWPIVQRISPARKAALKARLKDCGGIEGWTDAIQKAVDSDFLCGRTDKAWTGFGFDWLTKSANFTKLMEGNYANRTDNQKHSNTHATGREIAFAAGAIRTPSVDCF